MIGSHLRNLTLGAALICALAFLLHKTQSVDFEEHDRYISTLRQLQNIDATLNENIIRSRHGYSGSYDPIVQNIRGLKRISEQLVNLPAFIEPKNRSQLEPLREEFARQLEEKEELAERFKEENAILRNSLGFFPVAAAELAARVGPQDEALAREVRNLLEQILLYNLHSVEEALPRIEKRIATLAAIQTGHPDAGIGRALQRVLQHADTILSVKKHLDLATRQVLDLPTRHTLQSLTQTYQNHYTQASAKANRYRLGLYLVAILLLTIVAYTVIRLRNATVALNRANATLEQRVQDRTVDLEKANAILSQQKEELSIYIEEIRAAKEELQRIAVTDQLTGLFTRRFLFEWMEKQVASIGRNTGTFSILLFDIDFFKRINDAFGHGEGDRVLQQFAEVVRGNVRQADFVGRYGGEEFLVLLPGTGIDDAMMVAEKVRQAIEVNIKTPKQVTTSIGVSSCSCRIVSHSCYNGSEVISTLLEQADQALYRAKENGRNRVERCQKIIELNPGDPVQKKVQV